MSVKFANNAFGTLSAGITASGTSITLSSGQGARFPSLSSGEYFYATLIDTSNNLEIVKCTARSSDVLTVTRGAESTTARVFAIGDRLELRVTAGGLEDAANPYDKDTSSTGSLALPVGTDAQEPAAADTEGHIRYNSDDSVVYYSDGTSWLKISSVVATLSSVTGTIYAGAASTLTLAGTGFLTSNLVVNFLQSSDSIDADVTVTPTSDTAATVTVPAAVYNNVTTGNVVAVKVTNADSVSSAAVNKTAAALPSGGTVTTSGGYRIHTFTSSGNFTVSSGVTLSCECLIVGGGGGGGRHSGGGGGAGGLLYYGAETPKTPNGAALSIGGGTHTVSVGAGAAATGGSYSSSNITGNNSTGQGAQGFDGTASSLAISGGSTYSATGGGGGGYYAYGGRAGGSGGGGSRGHGGGSGTSGQGFAGGAGSYGASTPYPGSGGGGAAEVGENNNQGNLAGGDGLQYSISGSATYYAGGGGGHVQDNTAGWSGGDGGQGGGGRGNKASAGVAGTANTGGGGGGDYYNASGAGAGGSGIVIIRYQL